MEAYNIKSNEWFHVAPMNTRRSSVGVGVVGGKTGSPQVSVSRCSGLPGSRGRFIWRSEHAWKRTENSFDYIFLF